MLRPWTYVAAASYGVVAGLTIADNDPTSFLVAVALAAGLVLLAISVTRPSGGRSLVVLVALATGLHMAVALFVQAVAPGFGGGFVTGDDFNYFHLSEQLARSLQGLPVDPSFSTDQLTGGYAYHFGTFVYVETGLFRVFGPDIRIPLLMNAALGVAAAIVVYASAALLFDRRAALLAAAIVAFYPSLILWSGLNLRDPLVVAVATLAVWSLISFACSPRPITLILPFVAAAELVNLRGYVAVTIALAAVLSIAVAPTLSRARRSIIAAAIVVVAVVVVVQSASSEGLTAADQLFDSFERSRVTQAVGANTAIVAPGAPSDAPALVRNVLYLPTGLGYALFAPVPLLASRTQELIAAPEMLLWYLLCVLAAVTLWHERRRWRLLAAPTLTIAGLLLLLALLEGNVGGLFRHRGTVVPFIALLAAPTALRALARVRLMRSEPIAIAAREEPAQ